MTKKDYLKLKGELQVVLMEFKRKAVNDKVNILGEDYKNLEAKIIETFFKTRGFSIQEYLTYKETIKQKKIDKENKGKEDSKERVDNVDREIAGIKETSKKKGEEVTKKLSKKDQEIFDIKKSMKTLSQDTFEMVNENTHRVDTLLEVSKEDFMYLNDKIKGLADKLESAKKEVKKELKKPVKKEEKKALLTDDELKKIKDIIKDKPEYIGKLANLIGKRGMIPDEGYNDSYYNIFPQKAKSETISGTWDYNEIQFNPITESNTPEHNEGLIFYSEEDKALSYYNDSEDMTVNIGQELIIRFKNDQGSAVTNGQIIYCSGSSGDNPKGKLAKADALSTSDTGMAMVTETSIDDNAVGYATIYGIVRGIDTSSFDAGDAIYLSTTVAGGLTKTKPSYPNFAFKIGCVVRKHATEGSIFVDIDRHINVFTEGSVLFSNGNGELAEDNDNFFWDNTNNSLGVGTKTPEAKLHIAGGTTTRAPLKIGDGDLLTTPDCGVFEFANHKMYITNVGHQRAIDRTSDVALSTVTVANTTTETTVWTGEMEAGSVFIGNLFKFHADGIVSSASAADTVTVRVKVAGVAKMTLESEAKALSDDHWHMDGNATQRTLGATGSRAMHMDLMVGDYSTNIVGIGNIDTTSNMNITITVQWNNAKAGNTISLFQGFMEFKN